MVTPRQTGRVGITVVCVAGGRDFVKEMLVPVGQTAGWCVNASGILAREAGLRDSRLGIWGKLVQPEVEVREGDRIEIYVPCDPQAQIKARLRKAGGIAAAENLSDNAE
jgi:putative ubiquitin-RnfH superfamily antitoxin RatB of RatAB toxin-antitoxin module